MVSQLPSGEPVIGIKSVLAGVKSGDVKSVVVASNCPDFLVERIRKAGGGTDVFEGDQSQLGTKLGKPFAVAVVGFR